MQKQPLRGLSPHPQPLSPTRGEGSKTGKLRARLPGQNSADRPRARARFSHFSRWREKGPGVEGGELATARTARPGHSPRLRGRGGRGVRVVSAQPQAPKQLTRVQQSYPSQIYATS
ncbi:MAG: hypothetical protein RL240_2147 [Planctomycetota bacterium]